MLQRDFIAVAPDLSDSDSFGQVGVVAQGLHHRKAFLAENRPVRFERARHLGTRFRVCHLGGLAKAVLFDHLGVPQLLLDAPDCVCREMRGRDALRGALVVESKWFFLPDQLQTGSRALLPLTNSNNTSRCSA